MSFNRSNNPNRPKPGDRPLSRKSLPLAQRKVGGVRPGYAAQMPKVFPFKVNVSRDDAYNLIEELRVGQVDALVAEEWEVFSFAVCEHPLVLDGHVTFWMSHDAARYLLNINELGEVIETRIGE